MFTNASLKNFIFLSFEKPYMDDRALSEFSINNGDYTMLDFSILICKDDTFNNYYKYNIFLHQLTTLHHNSFLHVTIKLNIDFNQHDEIFEKFIDRVIEINKYYIINDEDKNERNADLKEIFNFFQSVVYFNTSTTTKKLSGVINKREHYINKIRSNLFKIIQPCIFLQIDINNDLENEKKLLAKLKYCLNKIELTNIYIILCLKGGLSDENKWNIIKHILTSVINYQNLNLFIYDHSGCNGDEKQDTFMFPFCAGVFDKPEHDINDDRNSKMYGTLFYTTVNSLNNEKDVADTILDRNNYMFSKKSDIIIEKSRNEIIRNKSDIELIESSSKYPMRKIDLYRQYLLCRVMDLMDKNHKITHRDVDLEEIEKKYLSFYLKKNHDQRYNSENLQQKKKIKLGNNCWNFPREQRKISSAISFGFLVQSIQANLNKKKKILFQPYLEFL